MMVELHFQEGFNGEGIQVLVNGEVRAQFGARTRYQIGLAHIEAVDLEPGQKLAINIQDSADPIEIAADSSSKYIIINKKPEQISVNQTDTMPGYV